LLLATIFSAFSNSLLADQSFITLNSLFVLFVIAFSTVVVWREYRFTKSMVKRKARKNNAYFKS
jgi:hypothetical protein